MEKKKTKALNDKEEEEKYIFEFDIDATKEILNEQNSNTDKLQIINRQMTTIKRLIELLENTKVVEWYGGTTGGWGILTSDNTLSDIIENIVETEIRIFDRKITEEGLKEIIAGIKNRLAESFIYLKNENEVLNRSVEIKNLQQFNRDNEKKYNTIGFQKEENKIEEDEVELKIKNEVNNIISEVMKIIKTKSVKIYLQEKLGNIWNEYQKNSVALGLQKKEFALKYFWENGLNTIGRYKHFNSFYKNIFLK